MTQIKATLLTGGNHIVSKVMQDTLCQYVNMMQYVIGRCMPRELFIKTPPLIRLCVQGQLHGNRRPISELSSTRTSPPCSVTISHTSDSPNPTPPFSRLLDLSTRKKG